MAGLNFQSIEGKRGRGFWPPMRVFESTSEPKENNIVVLSVEGRDYTFSAQGPDEKEILNAWMKFAVNEEDGVEVCEDEIIEQCDDWKGLEKLLDRFVTFYRKEN